MKRLAVFVCSFYVVYCLYITPGGFVCLCEVEGFRDSSCTIVDSVVSRVNIPPDYLIH